MVESSAPRFQMAGSRSAILDGPVAEVIEQQIDAIEKRRALQERLDVEAA